MEQGIACANPSKTINIISFPEMSTQAQWLKRTLTSTKWKSVSTSSRGYELPALMRPYKYTPIPHL